MSGPRKLTPLSNEEMDRRLREYLDKEANDREQGNTIANLRIEINQLVVILRKVLRDNEILQNENNELRESQRELITITEDLAGRVDVLEAGRRVDSIRISRHGDKFRTVEQKLDISDDGIDTGQWSIEELQRAMQAELNARELITKTRELAEVKEDKLWWKRARVGWTAGVIAWAGTSTLPFIAYAIYRVIVRQ